jgi:acetate kinase
VHVLVVNSGSSSLKLQRFDLPGRTALAGGVAERIGEPGAALWVQVRGADGAERRRERAQALPDHRAAFAALGAALRESGGEAALGQVDAIGHRVVHGGERFREPARVDDEVVAAIRALAPLAPLHNPANLLGIELCRGRFPGVPQVAVFDTAFHQGMPPRAYRYALPEALYTRHQVRRYGFHGTSHAWVARRSAEHLGRPAAELRLVTLHLGNGASAAAIAGGRSIDTSMGMTPLEGLVMGTRSGDLDPAVPFYLARATGESFEAIERLLNEESGLEGLCGAHDMREVLSRAERGDPRAALALDVYCYRIRKYVGAYTAALGHVDAIVFTAGVGENAPEVRRRVCEGLEGLGVRLDAERNQAPVAEVAELQQTGAALRLLVVRTREELEIAEQTRELLARPG